MTKSERSEGVSHANIWGRAFLPARKTTKCKSSEEDKCQAQSKDIEEANMAGTVWEEGGIAGDDFRDMGGWGEDEIREGILVHYENLGFYPGLQSKWRIMTETWYDRTHFSRILLADVLKTEQRQMRVEAEKPVRHCLALSSCSNPSKS